MMEGGGDEIRPKLCRLGPIKFIFFFLFTYCFYLTSIFRSNFLIMTNYHPHCLKTRSETRAGPMSLPTGRQKVQATRLALGSTVTHATLLVQRQPSTSESLTPRHRYHGQLMGESRHGCGSTRVFFLVSNCTCRFNN